MALAIFDLDNTLLAGDSDHSWGEYLVEQGLVDSVIYKEANERFYQQYLQGTLDIFEFCRFVFKPLKNNSYQRLLELRTDYLEQKIKPMIAPGAAKLIEKHKKAGDRLLIITATNSFITKPIGELLGIHELLGTDPEFDGKAFTGELKGTPCFQNGKVERLQFWLQENQQSLEGSYFYSDSHNDLPLLNEVDNPVAVDPDNELRLTAQDNGWSIISLRY